MIAAVLVSAALHAAWNALLKRERDTAAASVLVVSGAALLSAVLALTLESAAVPPAAWPSVFMVGAIETAYFVTLSAALVRLPLQTAYGLSRGLGLLLVWPLSFWLTTESAGGERLFGGLLLALGVLGTVDRGRSRSGLGFAVAAAATIAAYPIAYKLALERGVAPFSLFALSLAIALPGTFASLGRHAPARVVAAMCESGLRLGAIALVCATSFLLFLFALRDLGPGYVTALRNTSVLFASLYAWLLGEPISARAIVAALLVTAGAVMVAL